MGDKVFWYRVIVYLAAIAWGALQAWNSRFELFFADSQQYFDMAYYFSQGDFAKTVSLYWSPLYPLVAGLMFKLVSAPAYWQFFQFKLLNLAILLGTFFSFDFFFTHLYAYYINDIVAEDSDRAVISRNTLLFSGYALLILFSLAFGGVYQDTPDMLAAALLFLSSGLFLKFLLKPTKLGACLFGITCGFGYLAKAVMFSLTILYLAMMFVFRRNVVCILLSAACFALIAAPWVCSVSNRAGHFSIGESAKFVYINLVEERDPVSAEGLIHPPRILHRNPLVREFGQEMPGTCPFFYDIGYWTQGASVQVRIGDLVRAIILNSIYYVQTFLYIPFLILALVALRTRSWPLPARSLWKAAPLWAPPLALCLQYALVSNLYMTTYVNRYFIAAFPMAILGVLVAIRVSKEKYAKQLHQAVVLNTCVCFAIAFSTRFLFDASQFFTEKHHIWYNVSAALKTDGIKYGDAVAMLGCRIHRNSQFAEPDKLRIIANIWQEEVFWQQTPQQRQEVLDIVRAAGARAVVYSRVPDLEDPLFSQNMILMRSLFNLKIQMPFKNYPPPTDLTGWKQVPGSEVYYYLLF